MTLNKDVAWLLAEPPGLPIADGLALPQDIIIRARKHGLSETELRTFLTQQGYVCPICNIKLDSANMVIDHDHACHPGSSGCFRCVRGLLCRGCNSWLSYKRDPDLLRRGADYLERVHRGRRTQGDGT